MTNEQRDYPARYGAQQVGPGMGTLIKAPYQQMPPAVPNPPGHTIPPGVIPVQGFSSGNGIQGQFPGMVPVQTRRDGPEFLSTQHMQTVRPAGPGKPAAPKWQAQLRKHPLIFALSALCLFAVLAALGYSAWHVLKGTPSVTLYQAGMQTVSQEIGGGGVTYPAQRLDVSYPFTALVLSVFVKPGDKVALNQPLVRLDLAQINAQNISEFQPHAGSDAPAQPNGNLNAAMSGTVTAVNVYPGQLFGANKVMLTIYDESSVIVRAKIPLTYYSQVKINQPVQVTPSALAGVNFNGMVLSIIQNTDTQADTFEVWVKVINTQGNLLPGMSAFVQLQERVQAIVVPRLAVLNPDRDSIVFVERMQHVYIQHVQVIDESGDSMFISSGLAPKDLIVLVGLDSLQDGQAVRVAGIENAAQ